MNKILTVTTIALAFSIGSLLFSCWVHWKTLKMNMRATESLKETWSDISINAVDILKQISENEKAQEIRAERWKIIRDEAKGFVEKAQVISQELLLDEAAALAKEQSNNQTKENSDERQSDR